MVAQSRSVTFVPTSDGQHDVGTSPFLSHTVIRSGQRSSCEAGACQAFLVSFNIKSAEAKVKYRSPYGGLF